MTDADLFMDLRPLLAQGIDPLQSVVERAAAVEPAGRFILTAPFNPLPLRRVLGQMGFSSQATKLDDQHWQVALVRDGQGRIEGEPTPEDCPGLPDPGAPFRREADGLHIDVRGLVAPLPMLAILRLVASVETEERIIVHHDRDPIYLVPELAEIGWSIEPLPGDVGDLRFLVRRAA
jgi:hypothetical protein